MGKCTKCGTNFVGLPGHPVPDGLCRVCAYEELEQKDRLKTQEINILTAENNGLRKVLKDIANNWDCDSDSHKYGNPCRACMAKEALEKPYHRL